MVVVEQQMKFVINQQKIKQKTTVFGLSPHAADFAVLCVDASSSVVDTTREHFSYAITLDVPIFVVINKIDLCSKRSIQQTIGCLTYLLKHGNSSVKREPYVLEKDEDLVKAAEIHFKGFETTVQIENIRQRALIIEMNKVFDEFIYFLFNLKKNYMWIKK